MSEHEYLGESYEATEDALSRAAEAATADKLFEVPGFGADYFLRIAQVRATMALTEQVADLANLLQGFEETRQDERQDKTSHSARVADALERMTR